jgi:hypothetical protein
MAANSYVELIVLISLMHLNVQLCEEATGCVLCSSLLVVSKLFVSDYQCSFYSWVYTFQCTGAMLLRCFFYCWVSDCL